MLITWICPVEVVEPLVPDDPLDDDPLDEAPEPDCPDDPLDDDPLDEAPEPDCPDDPLDEDPELEPELELEALSCWPTVRLTAVIVPAIGEVRVAPARAAWASANCAWATVMLAWSAVIWAAEAAAVWSVESLASSEAIVAWAWAT